MLHESRSNGNRRTTKGLRRVRLIPIGVALLAVIAGFLWAAGVFRDRRSADERLAEIEAARAIPDSENAASIYNELLRDPKAISVLDDLPDSESVRERVFGLGRHSPWRSEEHPELVVWIAEHQFVIDRLVQTLPFDECRFPIIIDVTNWSDLGERVRAMRHWGDLLIVTANNDLADGRTDAAMVKWQCMLQMAHHLQQQPEGLDHLTALHNGQSAMLSLARFIMEASPGEAYLHRIEAMPIATADHSTRFCEETRLIDDLETQKQLESCGPRTRLRYFLWRHNPFRSHEPSIAERHRDLYLRYLTICRGTRILVALKRYERTTGQWPRSLDEVGSSLPDEVLIDPSNNGPFVYTPTADDFRLYSRGKNNVDENGKWESDAWKSGGCDDWLIWPPYYRTTAAKQKTPDR